MESLIAPDRKSEKFPPGILAGVEGVSAALSQIGRTAGLDQPTIDKCLTDDAMKNKIVTRIQDGEKLYGIKSTPSFIINGKAESGDMDYDTFYNLVKDLLPKA